MAKEKTFSIGMLVLRIALGAFLIVSGIITLQGGKGDDGVVAINYLFNGNLAKLLCILLGLVELVAGIIVILKLFVPIGGALNSILMLIIMIVWIAAIILIDVMGKGGIFNGFGRDMIHFLQTLASHLLVLGAIILVQE